MGGSWQRGFTAPVQSTDYVLSVVPFRSVRSRVPSQAATFGGVQSVTDAELAGSFQTIMTYGVSRILTDDVAVAVGLAERLRTMEDTG